MSNAKRRQWWRLKLAEDFTFDNRPLSFTAEFYATDANAKHLFRALEKATFFGGFDRSKMELEPIEMGRIEFDQPIIETKMMLILPSTPAGDQQSTLASYISFEFGEFPQQFWPDNDNWNFVDELMRWYPRTFGEMPAMRQVEIRLWPKRSQW